LESLLLILVTNFKQKNLRNTADSDHWEAVTKNCDFCVNTSGSCFWLLFFFLREIRLQQQYLPYVTREKAPLMPMYSLLGKGHELYLLNTNVGAICAIFKFSLATV